MGAWKTGYIRGRDFGETQKISHSLDELIRRHGIEGVDVVVNWDRVYVGTASEKYPWHYSGKVIVRMVGTTWEMEAGKAGKSRPHAGQLTVGYSGKMAPWLVDAKRGFGGWELERAGFIRDLDEAYWRSEESYALP